MRILRVFVVASTFATSLAAAAPQRAAPRLDAAFGKRGVAHYTTLVSSAPRAYAPISRDRHLSAVAMDPQGRILSLFAPTAFVNGRSGGLLTAVLPDGTADRAFGDGGDVDLTALGAFSRLALDSHGRILVVGSRVPAHGSGDGRTLVVRLTPNGRLDPTFGTGGQVELATFATWIDIVAAVDGSDSCFVFLKDQPRPGAGPTPPGLPDGSQLADLVVKLSADGIPDSSYVGVLPPKPTWSFDGPFVSRGPFAVDPTGRFVAAETRGPGGSGDRSIGVLRLDAGGLMDATFGDGGAVVLDLGPGSRSPADVAVDSSGRVVVLAAARPPALVRLLDDGSRDPSWGPAGDGVMNLSDSPTVRSTTSAKALAVDGTHYFVAEERYRLSGRGRQRYDAIVLRVDSAGGAAPAAWISPFPRFAYVSEIDGLVVRDGAPVVAGLVAFGAPRRRPSFALARVLFD